MKQLIAIVGFLAVTSAAQAATILDCTQGCSISDAGQPFGLAYWSTEAVQPSGSGVFGPFVRLQNTGTEDGHNTDGDLSNDEKNGVHTHSVLYSDLDNLVNIGGFAFYEFALDLGEPATQGQSTDPDSVLSLDQLKICAGDTGDLTRADDCPADPESYSLDLLEDRAVLLDYNYLGNGNGGSDLFVYIPYALVQSNKAYFYMYSAFGYQLGYETEGTYEEWAYQSRDSVGPICADGSIQEVCGPPPPPPPPPPPQVPEPASLLLLGAGLVAGAGKMRSRMRKQKA